MKAQASSLSHRLVGPTRLAVMSVLLIAVAFGCGNNGESGSSGTNGNGTGATGGNGTAAFGGAALCSAVFGPDGFTGFVRLVSDEELEAGDEIDATERAIEVAGGVTCAVHGRSVFALSFENPIVTRYDEVDGVLVEVGRLSFANFGLASLFSEAGQTRIISETKAYHFDTAGSQIVVWNPQAMETIGTIPLTVAEPPEGLLPGRLRAQRFGELLVGYLSYLTEQDISAPRTDFWFIDPQSDEVVATDVTEECGNLSPAVAEASNGDLYFGSPGITAASHGLGLPGTFAPCSLRVRAGTREIDSTYLADLNTLTGGLPTAGPIPAGNDRGLLFAYETGNIPIDPMLTARELQNILNWRYYEWTLGTEEPATLVESIPPRRVLPTRETSTAGLFSSDCPRIPPGLSLWT